MKVWYDWEFLEDGKTIDPISLGMVTSTGKELYLINKDADWVRINKHPWLMQNVVPQLTNDQDFWVTKKEMAEQVKSFLSSSRIELYAWFSSYDHIALAQLFGTMMNLPRNIPMYTTDLRSIMDWIDFPPELLPVQTGSIHNALEDAKWNRDVYNAMVRYGI